MSIPKEISKKFSNVGQRITRIEKRLDTVEGIVLPGDPPPPPPPPPSTGGPPGLSLLQFDDFAGPPEFKYGQWEGVPPDTCELLVNAGRGRPGRRMTAANPGAWQGGASGSNYRSELGRNESRNGIASASNTSGTFALLREGQRRVIRMGVRLSANWPMDDSYWALWMQLKQAQPNNESMSSPVLSSECRAGTIGLYGAADPYHGDESKVPPLMAASAYNPGDFIDIEYDITFSLDPNKGKVGGKIGTQTFASKKVQTLCPSSQNTYGYQTGDPIPSHMRIGPYYDKAVGKNLSVTIDRCEIWG